MKAVDLLADFIGQLVELGHIGRNLRVACFGVGGRAAEIDREAARAGRTGRSSVGFEFEVTLERFSVVLDGRPWPTLLSPVILVMTGPRGVDETLDYALEDPHGSSVRMDNEAVAEAFRVRR